MRGKATSCMLLSLFSGLAAHELCMDTSGPQPTTSLGICANFGYSPAHTCCKTQAQLDQATDVDESAFVSQDCLTLVQKMRCAQCDPWSAHLFNFEINNRPRDVPFLCAAFCTTVFDACRDEPLHLLNPNANISNSSLSLGEAFSHDQFCLANVNPEDAASYCFDGSPYVPQDFTPADDQPHICLRRLVNPISNDIYIYAQPFPGEPDTTIIATQAGKLLVFETISGTDGVPTLQQTGVFLDMSSQVFFNGERGLLSFAFHPEFQSNGRLFVSYSCNKDLCPIACGLSQSCSRLPDTVCNDNNVCDNFDHTNIVDELFVPVSATAGRRTTDAIAFATARVRTIHALPHPFGNHNGGQILFEATNLHNLLIFHGDGGRGGDPLGNGQNFGTPWGAALRIDVDATPDSGKQYAVPTDNPFLSVSSALPELYAKGLRNPWRCSYDRENPTYLFCGDVGQAEVEEVDLVLKGGNYGWGRFEGSRLFNADAPEVANHLLPILEYSHKVGKCVIGGYVYRGQRFREFFGKYIFADYTGPAFIAEESAPGSGVFTMEEVGLGCSVLSPLPCRGAGGIYSLAELADGEILFFAENGIFLLSSSTECGESGCDSLTPLTLMVGCIVTWLMHRYN